MLFITSRNVILNDESMDTASFSAFLAIVDTGSFSEAANTLFLTQPAISKRIAGLEQQLGTPLFDRIGRQISLTEAGRVLLPRARQIMELFNDTRQEIYNLNDEISGPLRIATSHHIGLHRLPEILKRFSRTWPQVSLDIRFVDSEDSYDLLAKGDIELGIVTLSPEDQPLVQPRLIWNDPLVFMAAKDHPLANSGQISPKTLSRHQAVLPGRNTFSYEIIRRFFEKEKLSLQTAMSTNYLETLKMLTSIGLAWSILPETMLDEGLIALDVRLKGNRPLPERKLGYIHHKKRTLSNGAKAFIRLLNAVSEKPIPR